jgi:hypothetical protein
MKAFVMMPLDGGNLAAPSPSPMRLGAFFYIVQFWLDLSMAASVR